MFTFAAKPRLIRLRHGASLTLPTDVTLTATLGPAWLFGAGGDETQFVLAGSKGVSMYFNGNTGKWFLKGGAQPKPPDLAIDIPTGGTLRIQGRVVRLNFRPNSLSELAQVAEAVLFGVPMLLNSRMAFSCTVESVVGATADGEFGYEIEELEFRVPLVDQQRYENEIAEALRYFANIGDQSSLRLNAALAYFYRSVRLLESSHTPWEFAAETVLNLSKCLEALFPPGGDGRTRDAVREGLAVHQIPHDDIETWFLPALALRSSLDVAHVKFAVLSKAHVETLARYTHGAVPHFRELLQRLLDAVTKGESRLAEYSPTPLEGAPLDVLAALVSRLAAQRPADPH